MTDGEGPQAGRLLRKASGRRLRRSLSQLGNLCLGVGFLISLLGASYYVYSFRAQAALTSLIRHQEEPSREGGGSNHEAGVLALEGAWTMQDSLPETTDSSSASSVEREPASNLEDNIGVGLATSLETLSSLSTDPVVSGMSPGRLPATTRIVIPAITLDSPVVELGTKYKDGNLVWQTANKAVGHHLGSAHPGEAGNIIMSGHISSPSEGAVFKRLPQVRLGDEVILYTPRREYLYQVVEIKVVLPGEVTVMKQTIDPMLTLITCVPDWVYTHRLIVIAKPKVSSPSSDAG